MFRVPRPSLALTIYSIFLRILFALGEGLIYKIFLTPLLLRWKFMKQQVCIFTTGGTIEKSYCENDGSIKNHESLLKEKLIKKLRLPHTEITVKEIMAKDSLDMTDEDRLSIFKFLKTHFNSHNEPVVILHGTDTMENTLKFCHKHMPRPPVAVIFTGAMRPAGLDDTDATQNFTEALFAAQIVPPGFYISFHGQLFNAPNVTKNRDLNTFEETF